MTALHLTAADLAYRPRPRPTPPAVPVVPRERVLERQKRIQMQQVEDLRLFREQEEIERAAQAERSRAIQEALNKLCEEQGYIHHATLRDSVRAKAKALCEYYGIEYQHMMAERRDGNYPKARHHLMWWLYKTTGWSLPQIGRYMGDRDHTTVLHGIRQHEKRIYIGTAWDDAGPVEWVRS